MKILIAKKRKPKIITFLFILCVIGFSYSLVNIVLWKADSRKTSDQIKFLIKPGSDEEGINFEELKRINSDVRGWVKVEGTNINYPFVQSKDNNFYLNHSFDKSFNRAGWVFLDYRTAVDSLGRNTIIYGHDRKDKTMFGSLNSITKSNWVGDKNNHFIKITTEKGDTSWQVFSFYRIKTTDDYLQTSFQTDRDYQKFLDLVGDRSIFDFETRPDKDDKILTLSTCYNKNEKTVLHAKQINEKYKQKF